ncbi:hypothetical protein OUZ56_021943 [Daphnia magna]|uniref:Uncharacterized protein n=1 Tax=Daphnia magna TaxID=35525 RepID=A0ABR0AUY0_9CRUS|nr:hypothetical protein OUZ56_021943 [Daphnia magna]
MVRKLLIFILTVNLFDHLEGKNNSNDRNTQEETYPKDTINVHNGKFAVQPIPVHFALYSMSGKAEGNSFIVHKNFYCFNILNFLQVRKLQFSAGQVSKGVF